ncbi:MAG: peptidase T [Chloroflexota bacterium]
MHQDSAVTYQLEADALNRLLRYVRIDTQSLAESATYPSTPGQLDLLRLLCGELLALGFVDARMDDFGYVTATLPATMAAEPAAPVIAFFAHVDTSPDAPGKDVQPIVWRKYDGGEFRLPGDPTQVLSPAESAPLGTHIGHDIVTSDGTTLLGADDKAGVAAAMAAAAYLIRHPEIPHGTVKFAFNPDEEVGQGVDHFDVQSFGATYAYTLDAGDAGEVEDETFSADAVTVRFFGRSAHPGYARGKLVNAIKIAADFVAMLPRDRLSPETTAGRDGFVHPTGITGAAEEAVVKLIVRDFQTSELGSKEAMLRDLAEATVARHPDSRYELTVHEQYRNMHDVLVNHPRVTVLADEAVRRVGLEPLHRPIRGGTDGARLCAMGLPTPNIFAGWQMIHSRREWVSVQDMGKAAQVIIELARLWLDERSAP